MDFWKTMGVLLRRWYVSVPVFVLSVVAGAGVFLAVPTQYESTGTIVLTAPTAGGVTAATPAQRTGPGNPLLDFEGSLTITTQLLIQSLSSPTVQNQIAAQGGVSTFQAGDGQTGGPFVVIIADAKSKAVAEKTVNLALKFAENELNTRQKTLNAPPSTYIGTQVVVAPTPADTKLGGKVRGGGVAFALGLIVSLAAAFAADSVMTNRKRRRKDERGAERVEEPVLDLDDEDGEPSAGKTHKMTPAPPPRQLPPPVRTGGGPRPAPRPQVGPAVNARREPFPQGGPKPHPAKPPRVHPAPAPVPSKVPNVVPSTNNGSAPAGKPVGNEGSTPNGATNGKVNNLDWPRAEFRSNDSSNG
jgi:hypothetical protein